MGGGNLFPMYRHQLTAIKPLRPLAPLPRLGTSLIGQRTMPMSGAPLLPANPLLTMMLQRWKKK
jgi:hypothetical protein